MSYLFCVFVCLSRFFFSCYLWVFAMSCSYLTFGLMSIICPRRCYNGTSSKLFAKLREQKETLYQSIERSISIAPENDMSYDWPPLHSSPSPRGALYRQRPFPVLLPVDLHRLPRPGHRCFAFGQSLSLAWKHFKKRKPKSVGPRSFLEKLLAIMKTP